MVGSSWIPPSTPLDRSDGCLHPVARQLRFLWSRSIPLSDQRHMQCWEKRKKTITPRSWGYGSPLYPEEIWNPSNLEILYISKEMPVCWETWQLIIIKLFCLNTYISFSSNFLTQNKVDGFSSGSDPYKNSFELAINHIEKHIFMKRSADTLLFKSTVVVSHPLSQILFLKNQLCIFTSRILKWQPGFPNPFDRLPLKLV